MTRKTALVTGAARGIGAAIAARLAADGWRVVATDRDPAGAAPPGGRFAPCDVADEAAVAALIAGIAAEEARLDGLVCNAGIMIRKPLAELSLAEWNAVLATNLTAAFLLARASAPLLRAAHGAVVTIASTRAHMSEPDTEAYAASKGGLVALTHALAISLGPDVRANAISPGWIATKGAPAAAGGPRRSSRRPGRRAGRHRRPRRLAGGARERLRHRRRVHCRRRDDTEDDLPRLMRQPVVPTTFRSRTRDRSAGLRSARLGAPRNVRGRAGLRFFSLPARTDGGACSSFGPCRARMPP